MPLYHCPFKNCSKEFTHRSKMVDHINSHTTYKRFQCIQCNSKFIKISHLQRHLVQHKDKYYFKCNCLKSFSTKDNLRRHQNNCGVFECEACGVKLGSNKEYSKHIMEHKEIERVYIGNQSY